MQAHAAHNTLVTLAPILLFSWLRRRETSARGLGTTICGCQMIFYGITLHWAYQYLAWSIPLWFFVGPGFTAAATAVIGAFVYGLYAYLCGSPLLLGIWNSRGHPFWPTPIVWLRDAAVLFCFGAAAVFFGRAVGREWRFAAEREET